MLATIRSCLYVSTRSLALYLGISPDMLKSISSGRRDWALAPLLAATTLFDALEQTTPVEELAHARAFLEQERLDTKKIWDREREKLENTLALAREELAELQKSRDDYLRGLHACERLLLTKPGTKQRKWLNLRKRELEHRLREKSHLKISLLKAEMKGLEVRIQQLKLLNSK